MKPSPTAQEQIADYANDETASGTDDMRSTSAPDTAPDHRVVAARAIVVAVLGVLAVISIRASDPISAWKVVLGSAIVGAAWLGVRFVGGRAALPEPWASRLPIGLAGAAVVFALLLGGWLAGSSTEYAYIDVSTTTVQFGAAGVVQLPDVIGLRYQDAVQVLAGVGLGAQIDGDVTNGSAEMTVVDMSPAPGFGVAAGSVITLRMSSVVAESTSFVTAVPQTADSTTLAPADTTELPGPQTTIAAPNSAPPTSLPPDTTLPPQPTASTTG